MGKFEYRFIKSSWGISIDVSGKHEILNDNPNWGKYISPNVWLDLRITNLTPKEVSLVELGIEFATKNINEKNKVKKNYLFTIVKIEFSECDYQAEGLVPAIWSWVNSELGVPLPKMKAGFDSFTNKYHFDWQNDLE